MREAPVRGAVEEHEGTRQLRTAVMWGLVFGVIQAASPLALWWLDAATVYAIGLVLIAAVYIGFAVADGRWVVIAVETNIAAIFVLSLPRPSRNRHGCSSSASRAMGSRTSGSIGLTSLRTLGGGPPSVSWLTGSPHRSSPSRSWRVFSSTISVVRWSPLSGEDHRATCGLNHLVLVGERNPEGAVTPRRHAKKTRWPGTLLSSGERTLAPREAVEQPDAAGAQ